MADPDRWSHKIDFRKINRGYEDYRLHEVVFVSGGRWIIECADIRIGWTEIKANNR